jgi:hypothetical protein
MRVIYVIAAVMLFALTACSEKDNGEPAPDLNGTWTGPISYTSHLEGAQDETFEGAFQILFSGTDYEYILKIRCPYLDDDAKILTGSGNYTDIQPIWKDFAKEDFAYYVVNLDSEELHLGKDHTIQISDLTEDSFRITFSLRDDVGNDMGYCVGQLLRDSSEPDIANYDVNAKGNASGDENEEWGTVTALISAFSPMPDDFVDSCNGKRVQVAYCYNKETAEYHIYGGQYCSDPEANEGKGVEYPALSGYNYFQINGGDAVYTVGSLSYPYTWSVYMEVTLP